MPSTSDAARPGPVAALVRALAERRRADVTGLAGAARGWVAKELAGPGRPARLLVAVAPGEEEADELSRDLAFFLGGPGAVLRVPADPVLPYDDLSPDRGLEVERLAALARLHLSPSGVRAVVVSARALARRMVPRAVFEAHTELVGKGVTLEREAFAARLVAIGYARVPLVEDPGTFAVRGGIVDVWSPVDERPVRLELFGDEVESAKAFDHESQRTLGDVEEVVVCPAREAFFTDDAKEAAKSAVRDAAERVNRPSSRVREVLDAIDQGTPFFGVEALLPGFHAGGLATLFDYLPDGVLAWIDGADSVELALEDLQAELAREHAASVKREELALPPEAHFLSPAEVQERLAKAPCVRRHGVWLGTDEPVRFDYGETSALRAEIQGAHGEEGALAPLTRRLEEWRKRGIAAVVACGTRAQADRLRRLLEDRRLAARLHDGALRPPKELYDPGVHAHLVLGDVSAGFVDQDGRLALVADAEIFGQRVRKRARATKIENAFAAAFRDLNEGDLVVHVEHGIARYLGLTKMQIRGVEGDVLVLAYDGQDRLYLPVSKLRQVQKFTGASPDAIRLDKLGGSSFALRKARVKEQLLKMAAELLDVYAARQAHPGYAFAKEDEVYREFEAEFPYEPTPDQAKAIEDVARDMRKEGRPGAGPMDRLVCGDVGYGKTEVAMRA
ncbi:MAG: CarD family transcriptional regulator, partial [Anaeromyxobacteraceae bacterium]